MGDRAEVVDKAAEVVDKEAEVVAEDPGEAVGEEIPVVAEVGIRAVAAVKVQEEAAVVDKVAEVVVAVDQAEAGVEVTRVVVEVVKDPVVVIQAAVVAVKARVVEGGLAAAGEAREAVEEAVDRAAAVSRVVAVTGKY